MCRGGIVDEGTALRAILVRGWLCCRPARENGLAAAYTGGRAADPRMDAAAF